MSATVKAMCDRLVRGRQENLADDRPAEFASWLDALERDYADEPAMLAYVAGARKVLEAAR